MAPRITDERLQEAVRRSASYAEVCRLLGSKPATGSQTHIKSRIVRAGIDTSHFTGQAWRRGQTFCKERKTPDQILVFLPEGSSRTNVKYLRRAMLESGRLEVCNLCGLVGEWNGRPLVLEVDHVDGNWLNNLLSNLRFLCPNCHAQETKQPSVA